MNKNKKVSEIKHNFSFRMIALILCGIVSTMAFYPASMENASAEEVEMRGVWVATVANIDYPKSQTTDAAVLKQELTEILDNCSKMGFNAVFLQVRPSGDALYKSSIFPWSRYLTGTQGVAPDGGFDPLAFAVEEAHKRGMQLHAWINPYRITNSPEDNNRLAENNPAVLNPNLVITDSNGKMYYNPGDSASIDLIVKGALEIVENYDVDGLHMDDYFYPDANFDDEGTYSYFKNEYPDKGNWRRNNVDNLVKALDEKLHQAKPDIAFGISPRGIWANKSEMAEGSDTSGGGSYSKIYADSRKWVKNGWVDYIMPQLYWYIGYEIADYSVLCDWWSDVVEGTGVKLYIGEGAYRTTSSSLPAWTGENGTNELRTHILNGRQSPNISGYCCYTYNDFMENTSIYSLMQEVNNKAASAPVETAPQISQKEEAPVTEEVVSPVPPVSDNMSDTDDHTVPTIGGKYVNTFKDMNEYWWAMDAVNALASKGIIKGRSKTEFDPDANITRADNTVLLLRILGKTATFEDNFDDVYQGKYYYNEIGMARALGITSGVGGNMFDPDAPIKRQDMATLAYRVMVEEGILTSIPNTTVLNQFADGDSIDFYAREAIAACVNAGLMSGYGDGTINPQGNASRIEVALFMYRIYQKIEATN